jgi:hypothetical protein
MPARRVVELTVWDVAHIIVRRGARRTIRGGPALPGSFPSRTSDFPAVCSYFVKFRICLRRRRMDCGVEGGHVRLSATKTSRWIKLLGVSFP